MTIPVSSPLHYYTGKFHVCSEYTVRHREIHWPNNGSVFTLQLAIFAHYLTQARLTTVVPSTHTDLVRPSPLTSLSFLHQLGSFIIWQVDLNHFVDMGGCHSFLRRSCKIFCSLRNIPAWPSLSTYLLALLGNIVPSMRGPFVNLQFPSSRTPPRSVECSPPNPYYNLSIRCEKADIIKLDHS